ncbi:Mature-T-Cell Proliferation I type [Phytophthora infestans]|uniref:Mature-T-Cell Proliferation I type n=1 Tax=Phytophthora infestans TaxID=4787 RepID=A0A8S9TI89_PHYIN|nr:Mature-T-Cell Proliferation I type [Phytophthora infestans]
MAEKELCERVCKKQACAIQFCLQRRGYQESKCADVIKRYYDCCATAKEAEQKTRTASSCFY